MALLNANLSPAGANSARGSAPCRYTYKTADTLATVDTSGYFNNVANILQVGDIIEVVTVSVLGASPEVPTEYGLVIVMSNASGVVDVSNAVDGTLTAALVDSD